MKGYSGGKRVWEIQEGAGEGIVSEVSLDIFLVIISSYYIYIGFVSDKML